MLKTPDLRVQRTINGLHEEGEQQKVSTETAAVSKRVNVKWKEDGAGGKRCTKHQEKHSGWCQSIKRRLQEGGAAAATQRHASAELERNRTGPLLRGPTCPDLR